MTLKDYLISLGLMPESARNESVDVEATATQIGEYLKERGPLSDIHLSAAGVFSGRLVVVGQDLGEFDADNCDFNTGLEIRDCVFRGDLSLRDAYVSKSFELKGVMVEGNLYLPSNLEDLKSDEIVIANLQVKGKILFGSP